MAVAKSPMKTQKADGTLRLNPNGDLVASAVEVLRDSMLKALESAKIAVVFYVSTAAKDTTRGAGDTNNASKELARLARNSSRRCRASSCKARIGTTNEHP